MNTSARAFPSLATRFVAVDVNTTASPSPEIVGSELGPSACAPPVATLARVVRAVCVSWTNTSSLEFVSPTTRLLACDLNATTRPSDEREGSSE